LKSGLIPTTEEYKRLLGLLREEYDLTTDKGDNFAEDMSKIAQKAKDAMGDAFMSIVDGSKSAGDAFKDMARIILKQAFELLVVKPIMDGLFGQNPSENGIGGLIGSLLGQKNGGAWNNGVQMYANGGVVTAPTGFQHSGGLGVMGEAGPEAIMPLKRGKNGKLGVQVEGGSQQPIVINQSFNFSANGDDSVKRIIAQEAPKIANLTQKQILDQRARGGAFRTTFG
jgi:lambda family phage tail tape measure protein